MGKYSTKIATAFFSALVVVGAWFGVLYSEEHRRIAKAAEREAAYLEELKTIDQDRKAYFESVAKSRQEQAEAMAKAKAEYEALLQSQADAVKSQAKATTQVVNKPVVKQETVKVAKPKSTRKSKSS